jgi:hypothetical protein
MKHKKEQQDFNIRKEDKLMLLCSRTRINDEIKSQIISLIQQEMDWDYLLQKSSEHKLTPLLYWQLNKVCHDSVPKDVMEHLKTFFLENAQKNLLYMGELFKILDFFESQGITAIPYKGPILAIQAYGNLALREFDDLDIFIYKKDFPKTKELLISKDYEPQFLLRNAHEKKYIESQREYKFINHNNNINLEIHWNFTGLSFNGDWDHFENLEQIQSNKIQNKDLYSIPSEEMLLILCLHASGHLWQRISWICDINEFINSHQNMDWQYLMKTADNLRVKRILITNLLLAVDILDLEIPGYNIDNLESDEFCKNLSFTIKNNLLKTKKSNGIYSKAVLRLKLREYKTDKIKDLLRLMFKPTTNEWKTHILPSYLKNKY